VPKEVEAWTINDRHWPALAATGFCVDRALDMDCAAQKESSGMNATTSAVAGSSNTVQMTCAPPWAGKAVHLASGRFVK